MGVRVCVYNFFSVWGHVCVCVREFFYLHVSVSVCVLVCAFVSECSTCGT